MSAWRAVGCLFALFFGVALAFSASAQNRTVMVRSGEHANFSRLVFELGQHLDWEVTKDEAGYQIQFQSPLILFDLSQVFSRLSRTRISDLTAETIEDATRVRLDTPCQCHIEIFEISPGRLVVDIKDGETDESALLVRDATISDPAVDVEKTVEPEQPQTTVLQPPDHRAERLTKIAPEHRSETADEYSQNHKVPFGLVLPDPRVVEAQERLVAQLGRAMTQGVVEPTGLGLVARTDPSATNPDHVPDKTTPSQHGSADPIEPLSKTALDHINLNVQNVLDRDRAQSSTESEPEGLSKACSEFADFDIQSWSPDNDFNDAAAALRLSLVGELDRVDRDALESLVKLYIFHGFGSEARALMTAFKGELTQASMLADLSELLETGAVLDSSALRSLAFCTGPIAFWVMAVIGPGLMPEPGSLSRMIDTFDSLPKPLRERIGPALGTKFLDAGIVAEATKIANLIARAPGDHGYDFALFDARLDLVREQTNEARKTLWALINSNQPNAPDATVLLITDYLASGEPVPEQLVIEAASRALEMRFSETGKALRRLEIRALAQAQQQAIAFDILVHEAAIGIFSPDEQNEIFGDIFQTFDASRQAPERLLETYFQYSNLLTVQPSMDPARRQLADAFLKIGLPETAVDIMKEIQDRWTDRDRLLLGQAWLSMAAPTATLEVLQDVKTSEASDLRAKALLMQGSLDPAFQSLSDTSDHDLSERIIWQSGRYDLVSESSLPTRQVAASYVLEKQPSKAAKTEGDVQAEAAGAFQSKLESPQDLTLLSLQQMLASSRLSREFLENFLNDHPDP